jgi:hypothetical protein
MIGGGGDWDGRVIGEGVGGQGIETGGLAEGSVGGEGVFGVFELFAVLGMGGGSPIKMG